MKPKIKHIEFDPLASATHQPLLRMVMDLFLPQVVLEFGVGIYSTPIISEYKPEKHIGIESDLHWLAKVFPRTGIMTFIHQPISFTLGDRFSDLPIDIRTELIAEYKELKEELEETLNNKSNLIFVDNYSAGRMLAINIFKDKASFIIYHDNEPEGVNQYEYDFTKGFEEFDNYVLITPTSWAGLLIRKEIEFDPEWITRYIDLFTEVKEFSRFDPTMYKLIKI